MHPRTLPPGPEALRAWFAWSSLPLEASQYKLLWRYHTLLRERNAACDLTRIHQFDAMVQKHYIDSVWVTKVLRRPLPNPLLDLGTGAGLPGIPLKIVSPGTRLILAEGRHLRVQFLREVIEALHLRDVEIWDRRIGPEFRTPVQGVITRAVEAIPGTLARVRGCIQAGGRVLFMKGPGCDPEIAAAKEAFAEIYSLEEDIPYCLPHSPHRRRLVVFRRLDAHNRPAPPS